MPSTYAQRKASKARKLAAEKQESQAPAVDPDFPEEMGAVTSDDPALTSVNPCPAPVTRVKRPKSLGAVVVAEALGMDPAALEADQTYGVVLTKDGPVPMQREAERTLNVLHGGGHSISLPTAVVGSQVPPLDPAALFAAWLASPQGLDCTDPRCPSDPLRKRADLETRLKLAFVAGMGAVGAVGV